MSKGIAYILGCGGVAMVVVLAAGIRSPAAASETVDGEVVAEHVVAPAAADDRAASEVHTFSNVAWVKVDSTGRVIDHETATAADLSSCALGLCAIPSQPLESVQMAEPENLMGGSTLLTKWVVVDATSNKIVEYASVPSGTKCGTEVSYTQDPGGPMFFVGVDCVNPCGDGCQVDKLEVDGGAAWRYSCSCAD